MSVPTNLSGPLAGTGCSSFFNSGNVPFRANVLPLLTAGNTLLAVCSQKFFQHGVVQSAWTRGPTLTEWCQ